MKLSKSEEKIMGYLWQLKRASLKEIINCYPDPKPAMTTVATLLKRMVDKAVIAFEQEGKARMYYPVVEKKTYFSKNLNDIVTRFFDNSPIQFASFFTKESDFSKEELEDLKKIIDQQIKNLE